MRFLSSQCLSTYLRSTIKRSTRSVPIHAALLCLPNQLAAKLAVFFWRGPLLS